MTKKSIDEKFLGFKTLNRRKTEVQSVPPPRKTRLEDLASGKIKPYQKKTNVKGFEKKRERQVNKNDYEGLVPYSRDIEDEVVVPTTQTKSETEKEKVTRSVDWVELKDKMGTEKGESLCKLGESYTNTNAALVLVKYLLEFTDPIVSLNLSEYGYFLSYALADDSNGQLEVLKLIDSYCKERNYSSVDEEPLLCLIFNKLVDVIVSRDVFESWFTQAGRKALFQSKNWFCQLPNYESEDELDLESDF